jgi:hypothetical protein
VPYRILSLDGGGAWALIEVRTLIDLYGANTLGHAVLRCFDLVAANSGGSIVLAGLVENKSLSDILTLFENEANRLSIFSPTKDLSDQALRGIAGIGPKYSAVAKLPALERLLPNTGDKPLHNIIPDVFGPGGNPVHLLIITFDYNRNAATFLRSAPSGMDAFGIGAPTTISLAGAVHASTNAPVNYFDAPADLPDSTDRYWDGGLTGNNNPALAAAVEAIALGNALGDLRILSLGTASVRLPLADIGAPASPYFTPRPTSSTIVDLTKLATTILDDPPDFATFTVHAMTGGGAGLPDGVVSRIVRMNPLISPAYVNGAWTAPQGWTAAQFQYICQMDMDAITPAEVAYIDSWCSLWMAGNSRNQPIRMDGTTFDVEVGYGTYGEAKAAWRSLSPSLAPPVPSAPG